MKSEIKTTFEITLTLNAREASWLKAMTQNFLGYGDSGLQESPEESSIRKAIFEALPSIQDLMNLTKHESPRTPEVTNLWDHSKDFQVTPRQVARIPARKVDGMDLT